MSWTCVCVWRCDRVDLVVVECDGLDLVAIECDGVDLARCSV